MIGYIKPLQKFADTFLALILIAMVLHNQDFFRQLPTQLATAATHPATLPTDALSPYIQTGGTQTAQAQQSQAGGVVNGILGVVGIGTKLLGAL